MAVQSFTQSRKGRRKSVIAEGAIGIEDLILKIGGGILIIDER